MAMTADLIVRLVPLAWQLMIQSTGSDSIWREYDLDTAILTDWGPKLAGITLHTSTESGTLNVEWKVVLYWSVDGRKWKGPFDLTSVMDESSDQLIHGEFTDKSKLGLKLRVALAVKNASGQSGSVESAIITAAAACRFLG